MKYLTTGNQASTGHYKMTMPIWASSRLNLLKNNENIELQTADIMIAKK
jgi:hypothetical protein